jgi:DNA excision repair protein ERCC-4
MTADERDGGGPLIVSTVRATLASGDYSLDGYADRVAVERKSLADLYGTLGGGRERFERELRRLNEMDYAAVVIEADWSTIINHPPRRSRLTPKSVFRSVVAWQQRWPYVHWWAMPGRDYAEQAAFRILERFWRNRE